MAHFTQTRESRRQEESSSLGKKTKNNPLSLSNHPEPAVKKVFVFELGGLSFLSHCLYDSSLCILILILFFMMM